MDAQMLSIAQKAVSMALILSAPMLATGLVVGLAVSIFQAATQIQEMTVSFVPKMIAEVLIVILMGPWMLKVMVGFSRELLLSIPGLVK